MKKAISIFLTIGASLLFCTANSMVNLQPPESRILLLKIMTNPVGFSEQIALLEQEVQRLQEQTLKLQQRVKELEEVHHVKATGSSQQPFGEGWETIFKKANILNLLTDPHVSLGLVVLVVLSFIWKWWISRRNKHKRNNIRNERRAAENQYSSYPAYEPQRKPQDEIPINPMDSIPTKLNLAHAYIAMEDYLAARKILKEIAESGSSIQQAEAQRLLRTFAPS